MDNRNNAKFTRTNRDMVRARSEADTEERIAKLTEEITGKGYSVEFGQIGKKTTYCLLSKDDEEIVGYTFIQNTKYLNEKVGKLKALQQAISRKELRDERAKEEAASEK